MTLDAKSRMAPNGAAQKTGDPAGNGSPWRARASATTQTPGQASSGA